MRARGVLKRIRYLGQLGTARSELTPQVSCVGKDNAKTICHRLIRHLRT